MSWTQPSTTGLQEAVDAAAARDDVPIPGLLADLRSADREPAAHQALAQVLADRLRAAGARVSVDRTRSAPVVLAELGGAEGPVYTIQWYGHYDVRPPASARPGSSMREALAAMVTATRALASEQAVGRSQRLLMTFHGESSRPASVARELVRRNWYGDGLLSGCTCHLGGRDGGEAGPFPGRRAYFGPSPDNDLAASIRWATSRVDGSEAAFASTTAGYLGAFSRVGVAVAAIAGLNPDGADRDGAAGARELTALARVYAMTSLHYLQVITT